MYCPHIPNPRHSCKRLEHIDLSRYSAFMMTKNINSHGALKYSNTPVSLNDIAKTVCAATIKNESAMGTMGTTYFLAKNPPSDNTDPSHFQMLIKL